MRRLPHRWAVVAACAALASIAGGCGDGQPDPAPAATAEPPGVTPVHLTIRADGPEELRATRRDGRLVATATVVGRAQPFSVLRVASACTADTCTTGARVGEDGQWEARVRVSATPDHPYARVTAELGGQSAVTLVKLNGPSPRRRQAARPRREPRADRRAERREPPASRQRDAQPTTPAPAPAPQPSAEPTLDAPDPALTGEVLVVGDSLEVMSSPYLQKYLPGVRLTINVRGGYSSLQIFRLFQESFRPQHSVIVFDAGTNDNPHYPQILQGRLAAVAAAVGNRCMVVPTIHGTPVDGVDSTGKNRVVRAFAASRPGTQVPDWAGWVAAHPEMMQSDDLHPNAQGADLRAQLIAQGITGCLRQQTLQLP